MLLLLLAAIYVLIRITIEHCDLLIDDRVECGYPGISEIECEDRNCCWIPFSADDLRNPPWCSLSSNDYCGYKMMSSHLLQDRCNMSRTADITIDNVYEDVLRVKIIRSSDEFEIPANVYPAPDNFSFKNKLKFEEYEDKYGNFNFKIKRIHTGEVIWDTDLRHESSSSSIRLKLLYTQIGSYLPSNHSLYGLGYHAGKLKIGPRSRIALFSRDSPTIQNENLYGAHPFYIQIQNGKAHGVYLRNSYGMDVLVEENYIKFKILGGPIDLFFFSGSSPLDVIEQYTRIVGRPIMFDYRVLGFHQSRYGYKNVSQISKMVNEFEKAQIPLDTIWLDIDYMEDKKDFTIDRINFPEKGLNEFVQSLLKSHKRIVPILDPGIKIDENYGPYVHGVEQAIFIKNPQYLPKNYQFYIGKVWPGNVHFVDFMNPKSLNYWKSEIKVFFKLFNNSDVIGGIWLDMNEPSNFIDGYNYTFNDLPASYNSFSLNFPRYMINNGGNEAPIFRKTVPMDAGTALGSSYQTHNMYGLFESIVTYRALIELDPQHRPFLLTRSTFPGSGNWTATWLGDNFSTFPQMALSISGVLQYGLMGMPMSGPDICGFLGNATEILCARWMALGAFYPFSRNHNSIDSTIDQEPFRWKSVADVSRKYLNLRYSLLPFYYTLIHTSHVKGWPLWRPVFFYDNSTEALDINDQFFVGKELIVSPVLMESTEEMNIRLPAGEWYELESFNYIKSSLKPIRVLYSTPIDFMNIHIRAGSVLIMQEPKLTMFETRQTNFTLLVALDSDGYASGELYWDDGVSLSVGSDYINIIFQVNVVEGSSLRIKFAGHVGCECPFVTKLVTLTAGKNYKPKNDSNYNEVLKDYGFEIIFKKNIEMKELEDFIIKFEENSSNNESRF